jgi:hypothetical protein
VPVISLPATAEDAIHGAILLVLLPSWLVVGLIDWYCHRKSKIELTTGVRESIIHLALSLEAATAILSAMLFEINAMVLTIIVTAFIAHEITTNIDVHIAFPARTFTTTEQRIHDFLTAIPFAAVCLILATHIDQVGAIFGFGGSSADWGRRWKSPPLPMAYLIAWNAAALALNIGPYTEELIRCWRRGKDASKETVL